MASLESEEVTYPQEHDDEFFKRSCQIKELKAQVAKLQQMDIELLGHLERIEFNVAEAKINLQQRRVDMDGLSETLEKMLQDGYPLPKAVEDALRNNAEYSIGRVDIPCGFSNVSLVSHDTQVAMHLFKAQGSARREMLALAKKHE
ncbi:hypothetical protein BC567DRAFT_245607 [Phyllosticta citribraziliensis]